MDLNSQLGLLLLMELVNWSSYIDILKACFSSHSSECLFYVLPIMKWQHTIIAKSWVCSDRATHSNGRHALRCAVLCCTVAVAAAVVSV